MFLRRSLISRLILIWMMALVPSVFAAGQAKYFILMVWDGMRPDFVTPELTPNLYAMREQGVWFANHHSAYLTSTEVNGAVLATGMFPNHSGVMANKEYRREIDSLNQYGTEALAAVRRGDEVTGGKYLLVPTVAELVQAAGGRTAVVGAKPVAMLHDRLPRTSDAAGSVWYANGSLPETLEGALTNRLGVFPDAGMPNAPRDAWAARCLTEAFWDKEMPRYSVLWLSEPDFSQHHSGPGSPDALVAIQSCDQRLGTVLAELDRRGIRAQTDIFVVSDHGFSTIGRDGDVAATLQAAGLNAKRAWQTPPTNDDVMVVGNGGSVLLYVINHSPDVIGKIVAALQRSPASGVIFTRAGMHGTFPLAEVNLDSPNAADVVVSSEWKTTTVMGEREAHLKAEVNNDGYSAYHAGGGMHVTLSPTDLHNLAVGAGPDFRRGVTSPIPSGNVDIAPTLMWLMGIHPAEAREGRVLSEALTVDAPALHDVQLGRRDAHERLDGGIWKQYLKFTEVNGVRYLEEGNGGMVPETPAAANK